MTLKLTDTRPFNPENVYPWKSMCRVILDLNGNEIGELHHDNSNKWIDGTYVNWIEIENNGWNVMVRIPKFWYKKSGFNESETDFTNGHAWYISDKPKEDYELHPAFMRCRDKLCDDLNGVAVEVNYRYRSAFLGWIDGQGRLRSLPNKPPQTIITIGNGRIASKKNGNGWGLLDYNLFYATQLLYLIEYGDYDSQTALGRGFVDGNSGKTNTGRTVEHGNHSYGENTGKQQVSYRGVEDIWGNCYYWIDGFYFDSHRNILIGNKGFNNSGDGYKSYLTDLTSNINGYIGDIFGSNELGVVIKKSGGSSTSKLYDYGYLHAPCLPVAGGRWNVGSAVGAFSFDCHLSASGASSDLSLSLAF